MNKKFAIFWETKDGVIHQGIIDYAVFDDARHMTEVLHELFPDNRYFIKEVEDE